MIVLAFVVGFAAAASAGDAFYDIPIRELKLVEGSLPTATVNRNWREYERLRAMLPYAVLDGGGEVYVVGQGVEGDPWYSPYGPRAPLIGDVPPEPNSPVATPPAVVARPAVDNPSMRLVMAGPAGKDLAGRLLLPNADLPGMIVLRFKVPAPAAKAEAKSAFYAGKVAHYEGLLSRDIPGGAWFRHQVRLAAAQLRPNSGDPQIRPTVVFPPTGGSPWSGDQELERTYELFTGGRALSENLQLDRALPQRAPNEKPVKLDSLTGITIQEIDWKPLIKDAKPALDPLAGKIPADQHVVFFPSFQAAIAVADETNRHNTPVLRLAQPRSENAGVVERYQRQLGLSMSTIARLLGPALARSVALTGSDPSLPTGTDLAVLFESRQPALLENLLLGRIAMAAAQCKDARPVQGETGGLRYRGFCSPDRRMSSYVASLGTAVVVANSPYQLGRLAAVQKGQSKSIAELPEYVFFRIRYPLGDPEETALVFLSDPTIRRWCGPRWRIADSRRTRAAAVLAELQASQADALVRKTAKAGPIYTDLPVLGGGELAIAPAGVVSSVYGTLDFMTPIGEIPLDEVTQAEADAYGAWRDGYQRNWNWAFDPIALRIGLGRQKLAADMTVMPMIVGTQYRELVSISQGGELAPTAGDPHDALSQLVLALNPKSPMLRSAENFLTMMNQAISLGWLGRWAYVSIDDDPFWSDLAKVKQKDGNDEVGKFFQENIGRIPVELRIDVSNPLRLAAFLTSARAFIEQTAPGLTHWESLKYKDQPYVRITPAKGNQAGLRELENLTVYYTPIDSALTITLSQKIIERVIDRSLDRKKAGAESGTEGDEVTKSDSGAKGDSPIFASRKLGQSPTRKSGQPPAKDVKAWLGSNVGLRVDHKILEVANAMGRDEYRREMQARCWGNLPILNQWKRLYPDRDPVQVHQQLWGAELVCPGGGKYVWNEKYRTLESTVYGHPGEPKDGPPAPPVLSDFATGDFGLTFENHGLRARAVLERKEENAK